VRIFAEGSISQLSPGISLNYGLICEAQREIATAGIKPLSMN